MKSLAGTVDVSGKEVAPRRALAQSVLVASADVVKAIRADNLPKQGALATARAAGLLAAKKTSDLIPHCHPISLTSVQVDFRFTEDSVVARCEVAAVERTGPEMEALCGATVAALTLYDMIKGIHRGARIAQTLLIEKQGGKSGRWNAESREV